MARKNTEAEIVRYFTSQSPDKVEVLFNIIKGIVSQRLPKRKRSTKSKKEENNDQ